ncbi:hypothetical protein [uncultured Mycolicibacterium sp.]|uniref:hypothetical protein n=1 Tax=uncultured Mycolicibacterium sp. TaxID=2320817 RepID=UPI002622E5D9|nr:hypothetical protein [uncultured Mycolicibacterium sp.]
MRYRLDVVAPDVVDVVRHAGGWLVDRAMAGWDVTVLTYGDADIRPLQILGVNALRFEDVVRSWRERPAPQTVAVAADLYDRDPRVRAGVRMAVQHGRTEVTLWGGDWPAELADGTAVQHQLSAAARAFKAQALAAVRAGAGPVGDTETFRCGAMLCPPVAADLVPAG